MDLPESAITELQELYCKEYGRELTADKAKELGSSLLSLMKTVYIKNRHSKEPSITRTPVTNY